MSSGLRFILLGVFLATLRVFAGEPKTDINVNVTLTEEGKKIDRPTRENPAYYRAAVVGFKEEGNLVAGEKKPDKGKVFQVLKKTLAAQGYLESAPDQVSSATLLLAFYWGYANPDRESDAASVYDPDMDQDMPITSFKNKEAMIGLVSGRTSKTVTDYNDKTVENDRAVQEAIEDRYFLIVSAYDLKTAITQKKKKLLWVARTSTPSARASSLAEVLPAMIDTAAPFFGQEVMPPVRSYVPVSRAGKVDVGPVTVRPDAPEGDAPRKTP